ncbi:MAG: META domain-containing protein [Flavobacteriales bacterium]|nr:META domain-containing protein [Flavobacteriales bacterium]
MKNLTIALLLLATLSANKCADKNGAAGMTNIADQKWIFQTLNGERLNLPDGTEAPWLKMVGDQLQGFGGCNALMGSVKLDGSNVSFPGLGSTKKFCEGVQPTENAIKGALAQVQSFKMDGGLLKLIGSAGEVATLRAE